MPIYCDNFFFQKRRNIKKFHIWKVGLVSEINSAMLNSYKMHGTVIFKDILVDQ
jgi:hypothetical protein